MKLIFKHICIVFITDIMKNNEIIPLIFFLPRSNNPDDSIYTIKDYKNLLKQL